MTAPVKHDRKRTRGGGVTVPPPRVAGALLDDSVSAAWPVAYGHVRQLPDGDVLLQVQVNVGADEVGDLIGVRLSAGLARALGYHLGRAAIGRSR
jgi:hypothetical protein